MISCDDFTSITSPMPAISTNRGGRLSTLFHDGLHTVQAGFPGGILLWDINWRLSNRLLFGGTYVTYPREITARYGAYRMLSTTTLSR